MSVVLRMMCVLLCAVFVSAEVMPMTDFDLEKMTGKWYLVGFATNSKWFASKKASMKMGTGTLTATKDGDLDLSYSYLKEDNSCWRMNNLAKKTETPGRFVFYNPRWRNDNDVRVVDAKFDDYAIIHIIKTKGGVTDILNKLHSRTPTVSEDLVEKFKKFCLETGIQEEDILVLPPNGECTVA